MLFNSLNFLVFLFIVVSIFYLLPHRYRWVWLLFSSFYFYTSWDVGPTLILLVVTLVSYVCALGIRFGGGKSRIVLVLGIVTNLGVLLTFKYFDFFIEQLANQLRIFELTDYVSLPRLNLPLPIGLSFYTFSTISYLVDVFRGQTEAERHLGKFAVYVAFFPKLFAGPIERAQTFLPQLRSRIQFDHQMVTEGLQLILWGLFKKVVIADRLGGFVDAAYKSPAYSSSFDLMIATYFFAFQLYCDFSAYTDIARGAAKLFGFNLMENFVRPYFSKSTTEFWGKRWHYSLATWFRDYMYIPMGGSRVHRLRHYFNLMAVFVVSGFWHAGLGFGVNRSFMAWGALNGFYQWVAVSTAPLWGKLGMIFPHAKDNRFLSAVRIVFTFHLITFAWIFFRANSLPDAFLIISRIYNQIGNLPFLIQSYGYTSELIISFALIGFLLVVEIFDERTSVWQRLRTKPVFIRWGVYYVLIIGLIVLGKWGSAQFVYMQF